MWKEVSGEFVITLAPTRVNWLITLPTEVPLPGIGLDENSTVSPGDNLDETVCTIRNSTQGSHRFTLRTCTYDTDTI